MGEGAEVSGGHPMSGFYLGFFVWGEVDPKKFLDPRSGDKKKFLGLLGVWGHVHLEKFEKISVQDWLKSHFWTLVIFTDSLISSSNKISI